MATKFYVYGGGRWREIDLNTGRVSGWAASARFLVGRRGRLECARAAPVLRALRSLAAGEPSHASDGPRLSHASWMKEDQVTKLHQTSANSICEHCCQHRRHNAVQNSCGHAPPVAPLPPPEAPMAAPPAPASLPAPPAPAQLSTRTSHTMDEMFNKLKNEGPQNPNTGSSRVVKHSPHKRLTPQTRKRRRSFSDDSETVLISNTVSRMKDIGGRVNDRNKLRGRPVRRSSGNILGMVKIADSKTDLDINAQVKNIIVKKPGVRSKTTPQQNRDAMRRVSRSTNNANLNIESNKVDENHRTFSISESKDHKEDSQLARDDNAAFAHALHSGGRTAASGHVTWTTPPGTSELCKELVIDEEDVAVLRTFLQRNTPEVSLRRFDFDDEYKRGIFYRLNPLVIVERSERVQQMLNAADELRDFASQLGLRSVSDKSVHKNEHFNGAVTKSRRKLKQPDRFSVQASPQPNKSPKKQLQPSKSSPKRKEVSKKLESDNKSTKGSPQKRSVSPPSVPQPRPKAEPKKPKTMQAQATISGKNRNGGPKEYSRAEDAAIVTWISSDGRARLVNGNRVWRELQGQFERLVGHGRTWQSLRNRYLRYILPTLSSLAVPPDRAARLRAAAAAGEIKRSRWQSRRNSIFATPGVRGAWSRRPRTPPPRSPTHSPAQAPPTRAPQARSPSPVQHTDTDNTSSSSETTSRRAPSAQESKRASSSSSEPPAQSSENKRTTRLSLVKRSQPTRLSHRNAESRKQDQKAARPSFVGKENQVRRSSSSEKPTRATHSTLKSVKRSRILSSSDNPTAVSVPSTAKRMRRSSSSERPTRVTRSSFGKGKQARRSSSSEIQLPVTVSSSSVKSMRVRRSSSSSSSSDSLPSKRGEELRYSEVTRRFAQKQKARQSEDSTSPSKSQSLLPAPKGSRSRRLFNPKAVL